MNDHLPVGRISQAELQFDRIRKRVGAILAPAVFLAILALPLPSLTVPAHRLAAVFAMVVVLWVTEALPLPVTALVGPMLAVMLGVAPAQGAFAPFANPLIFLFIGSFILSKAIFVHHLNERIAYSVMSWKIIGPRPMRILFAYGAIAAVTSAWMSNTATAAMLLPIGLSLVAFMEKESDINPRFGTVMLLTTAYGCSLGGLATIIGTPPNVIAVGMLEEFVGVRISFLEWMTFAVPVALVLLVFLLLYVAWVGAPGIREIPGTEQIIQQRRKDLGPMTTGERSVLIAFGVTVALWVMPGVLPIVLGADHPFAVGLAAAVPVSVAALIGTTLLFVLPGGGDGGPALSWKEAAGIDWGTILLFGGGLSLGGLAFSTGLAEVLGRGVTGLFPISSVVVLTYVSAGFLIFFTEAMSNTAATNVMIPVIISIAQGAGVDPIPPAIAASLAASIAVMLPVSTPPNAIVYSSGRVPIISMIKYGIVVDIVALAVIPTIVLLVLG